MSRRQFDGTAAAAAPVLLIRPSRESMRRQGANEQIACGLIGTGRRCAGTRRLRGFPGDHEANGRRVRREGYDLPRA